MKIAYHASHEQFAPAELLAWTCRAEAHGFDAFNSSDHFAPWQQNGQSGFAWSWLGAALQATQLKASVVCAPGQRYHPAIIAQAAATLAEMYPGRFTLNLGSGEAINEAVTGAPWPPKAQRQARLLECVQVIRRLWAGEEVEHAGLVRVKRARLYTLPRRAPAIFAAALSEETARWAGDWADGLVTTARPLAELEQLVAAFRANGGAGKPLHLKVDISYAASEPAALEGAMREWRMAGVPAGVLEDAQQPEDIERAAAAVTPEQLRKAVHIGADLAEHTARLNNYAALGFERLILHNVNREQAEFIEQFGRHVLPALRR
jgi:probable non-F420 flavinoid oxidoreductase